jgi:hypothetical protein
VDKLAVFRGNEGNGWDVAVLEYKSKAGPIETQGAAASARRERKRSGYPADQGCRRIAHIRGPAISPGLGRLRGYRRTLARRGLEAGPEYVVSGQHSDSSGYEAMVQLLSLDRRPDGQDFPQAESKNICHGFHEFHRPNLDFVKFVESVAVIWLRAG